MAARPASTEKGIVHLVKCAVIQLTLPIYSITLSMCYLLLGEVDGVRIFLSSASSNVFVYDSIALAWTRFTGFEPVRGRGNPYQNGTFLDGSLYFTTFEPFSVVGFDLQNGAWDIAAAPALPMELSFVRLVGGGDRLYLVGRVGRDGILRSLRLWELVVVKLDGNTRSWEELGLL
ncbi:hypothetical protein Cni_G19784 [Canna indica]|uniref:F-box/kelch-repeat protein n=1 Tax=Canna indica TaxID=4628 RepID=A0AAQ3QIY2_9LILI|nr:hypothetical protein Cni_G19784 [Canna indica]